MNSITKDSKAKVEAKSFAKAAFLGSFKNLGGWDVVGMFLASIYGCWTKNRGGFPPKWMVKIMENPMIKWMIWVVFPYFWKHPYRCRCWIRKRGERSFFKDERREVDGSFGGKSDVSFVLMWPRKPLSQAPTEDTKKDNSQKVEGCGSVLPIWASSKTSLYVSWRSCVIRSLRKQNSESRKLA